MLRKNLKPIELKKILFIGLSNIGDAVLTLPVLDYLRNKFPKSYIVVISGPRPREIFDDHKIINELIVYDKYAPASEKMCLARDLWSKRFDAVVDLRNTAFPLFTHYKLRTPFTKAPAQIKHMRSRHLWKLEKMLKVQKPTNAKKNFFRATTQTEAQCNALLEIQENNIIFAPGARSYEKRWHTEGFIKAAEMLHKNLNKNIILTGDDNDKEICREITEKAKVKVHDFSGKLNLQQVGFIVSKADAVLTNDSALSHIASYLDRAVVTLFGPTDFNKYAPWSKRAEFIHKKDINTIEPDEVFEALKRVMKP